MIPCECFLLRLLLIFISALDSSAQGLHCNCICSRTTGKRESKVLLAAKDDLLLFSPQHPQLCLFLRVSAKSSLVWLLFTKHTNSHTYWESLFFPSFWFCFVFFFFSSSRANPEPGPGLPLRCSLAHKHKAAFIILPVAAQGLASKSYWFLSSFSPLHKGRAFCKLLARFRPTKGTFIEPSLPTALLLSSRHLILLKFDYKAWKRRRRKEKRK